MFYTKVTRKGYFITYCEFPDDLPEGCEFTYHIRIHIVWSAERHVTWRLQNGDSDPSFDLWYKQYHRHRTRNWDIMCENTGICVIRSKIYFTVMHNLNDATIIIITGTCGRVSKKSTHNVFSPLNKVTKVFFTASLPCSAPPKETGLYYKIFDRFSHYSLTFNITVIRMVSS